MDFNAFLNEVSDRIKDFLPEKYADCTVNITTVHKNNQDLEALTVVSPDTNISPTIYLDSFYEKVNDGASMESVLTEIASIRVEHEMDKSMDVSKVIDFENVKDKILPRLVGIEGNDGYVDSRPHTVMDDIAVVYCIDLGEDNGASMSIPISNDLMKNWQVDTETLHAIAIKNMPELVTSTFRSMNEVMMDMMLPKMINDFGGDREAAEAMLKEMVPTDDKMFIIGNEKNMNGAAALLDEKIMDKVTEKLGNMFYILPSSVHECILVPADAGMDLASLEDMVKSVNATEVSPQDRLSDHVYMYDNETREIFRADRFAEHELKIENDKNLSDMPKDAVADMPKEKVEGKTAAKEKTTEKKTSLKGRLEDKKNVVKEKEKSAPAKEISKNKQTTL